MSFQVFAIRNSVITKGESKWELIQQHQGHVFRNIETGYIEIGTYSEDPNKFVCLELFRKVSGDLSVRFELI